MTTAEPQSADHSADVDPQDDLSPPVGDMGIGSQRSSGSIFNAPVFVRGDLNAAPGSGADPVACIDVTEVMRACRKTFIEPEGWAAFRSALEASSLVVLSGTEGGARTAAAVALLASKRTPVLELQLGESIPGLVEAVKVATGRHRGTGVVIECSEQDALARLTGFHLRSLTSAAANGKGAVVLVTRGTGKAVSNRSELVVCSIGAPDAQAMVHLAADGVEAVEHRAIAALPHLGTPTGPGMVRRLVEVVRANPELSPEDAAAALDGVPDAIDEWLASRPVGADVSWLAAAVTLEGSTPSRVEELAQSLTDDLVGPPGPDDGPRRYGKTHEGIPAGILTASRAQLRSRRHGTREALVVEVCPPYERDRLIVELWERLGADYRQAYVAWLHRLADEQFSVQRNAAVAAGILFAHDPEAAERLILRPWATSPKSSLGNCAAMALGVPALLGGNLVPARRLTRTWMSAADPYRQRTAIAAYGGPLGLWDVGCGGAWHLWHRLVSNDAQRPLAIRSLAGLVVGGESALDSRAAVIGLLSDATTHRRLAPIAFSVLPHVFRQLAGSSTWSRQSLAALQTSAEEATWKSLAQLLGTCLVSPRGFADARIAFGYLFEAVGQERVDVDVVRELIRQTKRELPGSAHPSLGARLSRLLNSERRATTRRAAAAEAVYSTFFQTPH